MNLVLKKAELDFVKLIEMNLSELFGETEISSQNNIYTFYRKVLINYLSGDLDSLRQIIADKTNDLTEHIKSEWQTALNIAYLRFLILEKQILSHCSIDEIKKNYCNTPVPPLWQGEFDFVLARIYDVKKQHTEAALYYMKAKKGFDKICATKKAIKSYFNSIICQERVTGLGSLHYQYADLIKEARKAKEYSVVGMSLLALSQKLMDVGALRTSLEYAQRALSFLSREKGSINYFKVLLHRSYLFYILGYTDKAKADYQEAKLSTHAEVLNAITVLENKSSRDSGHLADSVLPFAWLSRLHYEKNNLQNMGLQEEQLIYILLKGPCSKQLILEKIWNEQIDTEYIDLRFKKLMWRLKKKFPAMIHYEKGIYSIGSLQKIG
ncbi:MAG: hypothetical protein ACXVCP_19165 [Bdellovibrio sp.]